MKYSNLYAKTKKNTKSLSKGQSILDKGAYVKMSDVAGIYSFLPLGDMLIKNISSIVDAELQTIGFSTVTLPILQSRSLWERAGRWERYKKSSTFYTLADGRGGEFCLAPTAEESYISLIQSDVQSFRDLPIKLHQIGRKFRNEVRTRGGLLRSREFLMSDAYSSHATQSDMEKTFFEVGNAYQRIFSTLGLPETLSVEADSGSIGGSGSVEYILPLPIGEDTIVECNNCNYAANVEKAVGRADQLTSATETHIQQSSVIDTPNIKSVSELEEILGIQPNQMIKTVIFRVTGGDHEHLAACIRGDLTINAVKLANAIMADECIPATESEVRAVTGAPAGFAGPLDLDIPCVFDQSTEGMSNFLCGVNRKDMHAVNVNFGRDIDSPNTLYDLAQAKSGDLCIKCGDGVLHESKGIELAHIFQLGSAYSEPLGFDFTSEHATKEIVQMGCYGIGISRLPAVLAEKYAHPGGKEIVWPSSIAPFHVSVVPTKMEYLQKASHIEQTLKTLGISVLLDDRSCRFGQKMNDAELIGAPYFLIIGKDTEHDRVELKDRIACSVKKIATDDAVAFLKAAIISNP